MKKVNPYHIALYAVSEAKRRNFNPLDIVSKFAAKMHDFSTFPEELAMGIYMIQEYKIDELEGKEGMEKIKRELEGTREFEVLQEVINEICAKQSNYKEQEK